MRLDYHTSVARERVREADLVRHTAVRIDSRSFVVLGALGLPRTWARTMEVYLDALTASLALPASTSEQRVARAIATSRQTLIESLGSSTELQGPDVAMALAHFADGQLFVATAGPARVYVATRGRAQRVSTREESEEGVVRTSGSVAAVRSEPDMLVLLGSVSAFSVRAVKQVTGLLVTEPSTSGAALVSLLTEPAAHAGVGAAALAIRVG